MNVTIVLSDNRMTQFLRGAGMFEDFKAILSPLIEATMAKGCGKKVVEAIRKSCDNDGKYKLVAIVGKKIHYRDPKIKSVSDGQKWCCADEYFNALVQK